MIYIPTLGRYQVDTMYHIENSPVNITLVVQPHEAQGYKEIYEGRVQIKVLPPEVKGIAKTRQWIIDNAEEDRIIFMDDDIKIARRKDPTSVKLTKATQQDVDELLEWMYKQLDEYPVVGVSLRQGNNNHATSTSLNGQCIRVVGLDLTKLRQHGVRYDVIDMMSDRHIVLSMLRLGYSNIITNEWAQDHAGSNTPGGCATLRTPEMLATSAHKLAELHPGVVKIVKKEENSGWWDGGRVDTVVYWKKAYKQGVDKYGQR